MFEKLLSLFLHAKGGAIATVLVIGASGALVTATVENGVNTITITQPSTTTAGSQTTTGGSTTTTTNTTPNNTVTQTILALFNNNKKEGATEPTGGNDCSDAAHATNEQVKRVDAAYKTDREAVQALSKTAPKTDAAKKLVKDADNKIKGFRQAAVKAIHELFKSDACKGADENKDENKDEDKDVEEDDDATTGTTTGTTSTTTTTTVAISGTDAKALADAAIKAMDDEVANLKTKLAALPAATTTTNTTTTDKAKADKAKSDNKSGKSKGRSEGKTHDTEDND